MSKKVFRFKTIRPLSEAARILSFVGRHGGQKNWVEIKTSGTTKAKQKTSRVLFHLRARGLVDVKKDKKKIRVCLTEKGAIEFWKLELISTDELPNGFYCLVVFDIPEKRAILRDLFRLFLKENCFFPLQKSVWISSFDMVKILKKIFTAWQIDGWVKIFVVCENGVPKFRDNR